MWYWVFFLFASVLQNLLVLRDLYFAFTFSFHGSRKATLPGDRYLN
uniref:Uncharacterized protein n=1 Tax=Anopheles minimus TaxID=112268 RepID=A0A182WQ25_9DIPT